MGSSTDPGSLVSATAAVLRDAKTAFLAEHAGRCGYLRVDFVPSAEARQIRLTALFTLPDEREWHEVEVTLDLAELRRDPQGSATKAFARLADGIATVGIARLFRPRPFDPLPTLSDADL